MSIICTNNLKYNIGIDIGDGLMCPILYNYNIIPCHNIIKYSIPDIKMKLTFNLFIGNNILSEDNHNLYKFSIQSTENIIYIMINVDYILYNHNMIYVNIYNKIKTILIETISLPIIDIPCINKIIDITNYKLIFELKELIEIIKNKIDNKMINLDDNNIKMLNDKLDYIILNMIKINNTKLFEIKNNLKNKFFL